MKFAILISRVITGFILGWFFAIIGEQLVGMSIGYPLFIFWFSLSFVLFIFFKISQDWSLIDILLFNAVCFLTGHLLMSLSGMVEIPRL